MIGHVCELPVLVPFRQASTANERERAATDECAGWLRRARLLLATLPPSSERLM